MTSGEMVGQGPKEVEKSKTRRDVLCGFGWFKSIKPPSTGKPGRWEGGDTGGTSDSLEECILAVEIGEERRLADQPMVQAGVRAGPPRGRQPGP